MSAPGAARWAYSPLDCQVHLLVPAGDHPWGVLKTRCGEILPPKGPHQHERPPWGAHRTCPTCAQIAQQLTTIPTQRWVSPQDTPENQSGYPKTTRALWVRCPIDDQVHLLGARAVLELATVGCALAWCTILITTQDLTLRGVGTPCPTCLLAGSAL
ncbi:MAG: hypothetical protein JO115_13280 [Pseudonocardiales bacterium]|nr:hypothetical protein [Pseudonocardiales bacterium]